MGTGLHNSVSPAHTLFPGRPPRVAGPLCHTMADTPASPAADKPAAAPAPSLKKGALVRVLRSAYEGSVEARASESPLPLYALEGPGEILVIRGGYAQLRWRRPVPDVWLRVDQLEPFPGA